MPILIVSAFLAVTASQCPEPQAWLDGERSSKVERDETRARLEATWRALGADRDVVSALSAIGLRESRYDACAWHQLGPNERGFGPMGLFAKFHLRKVAPSIREALGESALYIPEVSAIASWRIFQNAKHRYGAKNYAEAGEIYGGRVRRAYFDPHRKARFCNRLAKRGVDCLEPIGKLGTGLERVASDDDVEFIVKLQAEHEDGS